MRAVAETIERSELVAIIDAASEGCAESTRAKLRHVAETTDAVAAGWFHCNGVGCPGSQAKRRNQSFQEAFDRAMGERFGRKWNDNAIFHPFEPFVVKVRAEEPEDNDPGLPVWPPSGGGLS